MFEHFTNRARRVLVLAQEEARFLRHNFLGTEHLLLGLIRENDGVAAVALAQLGIRLDDVRERVQEAIGPAGLPPTGSPPFTPRAKKVLELSHREALQLGHNYISTEHILLGLVREGEGVAAQVLVVLGADLTRVRQQVVQVLGDYATVPPAQGEAPAFGGRSSLRPLRCQLVEVRSLPHDRSGPRQGRAGARATRGRPPLLWELRDRTRPLRRGRRRVHAPVGQGDVRPSPPRRSAGPEAAVP